MKKSLLFFLLVLSIIPFSQIISGIKDELYKPFAQVMPEPKDGIQNVYSKIKYPAEAQKAGVEGKVYLLICY